MPGIAGVVNFADVAERLNPAVVNIDASSRSRRLSRVPPGSGLPPPRPDALDDPFEFRRRGSDAPRRGAGTGFIIDDDGHILTNHHVIENAERITVKLTDGRSLRAEVVGVDPDTDIALIKVQADSKKFAHAVLGDSDDLRVGEWVCAIGNPLAYEHTVTVGVVSFIGRKLFDMSLDNYIQTDAAINFGNSGGPLINARGEVIGINSAISRQASSIGFAVPINQAKADPAAVEGEGRRVARLHRRRAARCRSGPAALAAVAADRRRAGAGRHRRIARRACRAEAVRLDHGRRRTRRDDQRSADSRHRGARARLDGADRAASRRPPARGHRQARRTFTGATAPGPRARREPDRTSCCRPSGPASSADRDRNRRQQRASLRRSRRHDRVCSCSASSR